MALSVPEPGLVIRYAYLWRDEKIRGREEGEKDRPCMIVNIFEDGTGNKIVRVAPLSRTPPRDLSSAIELPPGVKRHLGLKDDPQWIITDETNRFIWPGPDLRPLPQSKSGRDFAYGLMPGALFRKVRDVFVATAGARRDFPVDRDGPG